MFTFGVQDSVTVTTVTLVVRNGDKSHPYVMSRVNTKDGYTFYNLVMRVPKSGVYFYRFEVRCGDTLYFVGRNEEGNAVAGDFLPEWQLTVYDKAFVLPARWGGDIVYHIFVDRFAKHGELQHLPQGGIAKDWNEDVDITSPDGVYHANDFYGGNLQGIIDKLDYLQELGVTILYLSPIFRSNSNHRYDTADYSQIDPMLGTNEDFARLVGKARIRGMRVMLDGVFNHTGSDSIYFNKERHFDSFGAMQGTASPYRDWYHIAKDNSYQAWWGIANVPTLNKQSKSLRRYLFGKGGIVDKWSRFDIDWRLDVVDELPDFYLDELRDCIRAANPNAIVIGEVWEDASNKVAYGEPRRYFTSGQLDGVMNYVFKDAILTYCMGGLAKDFACKINDIVENYPRQCLDNCLTLIGSHDTPRAINLLSGVNTLGWSKQRKRDFRLDAFDRRRGQDRLLIAAALQYTLPGMPSVYYGDEAGMQGWDDPINRRPYPWDSPDTNLIDYYKTLGRVRQSVASCLAGYVRFVPMGGLLVMLRGSENNQIAVVANTTDKPISCMLYNRCTDLLTDIKYEGPIFFPVNRVMILRPVLPNG